MPTIKITKRVVDAAEAREGRYVIFDAVIPGFGLRVYPSGEKSFIFEYRPGEGGRRAPVRRVTIGPAGEMTADAARRSAEQLRATALKGGDPQGELAAQRQAPTVSDLAKTFLSDHVEIKRTATTKSYYEDLLDRLVLPELGKLKAKDVHSGEVSRLHKSLKDRPFLANRVLAVIGAMYAFGEGAARLVPKGTNPAVDVERFEEPKRERLLSSDELIRLGAALRDAETVGIPWELREGAKVKHRAKDEALRVSVVAPHAVAAIRLLLLTGARLREILHLRWQEVDLERGLLLLPKHKTSRTTGVKAVVLNAPALEVLSSIERVGIYVIAGDSAGKKDEKPRSDLKRPWALITKHAGLEGLRIHDLRHNFASFGVGGGMGLPVIGKLLGHAQAATTQRYAHLDNDPLRRASNTIGAAIAAKMAPKVAEVAEENVVVLPTGKRAG